MTRADYEAYQKRFNEFMEDEGLENLSSSPYKCPDCGTPLSCGECPTCGKDGGEIVTEPYFSWRPCVVCRCPLGGDRYDCNGWSERDQVVKEYENVCGDCVYFAECGRLDDTTMLEIEKDGAT